MATYKIKWNDMAPSSLGAERTVEADKIIDTPDGKWIEFRDSSRGETVLRVRAADILSIEREGSTG